MAALVQRWLLWFLAETAERAVTVFLAQKPAVLVEAAAAARAATWGLAAEEQTPMNLLLLAFLAPAAVAAAGVIGRITRKKALAAAVVALEFWAKLQTGLLVALRKPPLAAEGAQMVQMESRLHRFHITTTMAALMVEAEPQITKDRPGLAAAADCGIETIFQ